MLGKLLKYDLKYLGKHLVIFYALALLCATFTRLTDFSLEGEATLITVLHVICYNASYLLCAGIVFATCMYIWRRFTQSMYGDESYLTHTLPIKNTTLWNAKFLGSVCTVICSVLVIIAAILIMSSSQGGISIMIFGYSGTTDNDLLLVIIFCFVVLTQWTFIIQSGITGIIIGNRANNKRKVHSIVWGFIVYMVGVVVMMAFLIIWEKLAGSVADSIMAKGSDLEIAKQIFEANITRMLQQFVGVGILYVVLIAITYGVNRKLLGRGVNIE